LLIILNILIKLKFMNCGKFRMQANFSSQQKHSSKRSAVYFDNIGSFLCDSVDGSLEMCGWDERNDACFQDAEFGSVDTRMRADHNPRTQGAS
jgi:hypothetical protein